MPPGGMPNAHPSPAGGVQPSPAIQRAAPSANPGAVPPPTQAINKSRFLAPKGQAPTANIEALHQERHEVRQGNQVFIQEPDRTIIEGNNRIIIRHNEVDRFAVGARDVRVERRGNQTDTVVMRPDGVQIIDIDDDEGHLLRRVRRDRDGREIVIIDNGFAGPQAPMFIDVPPPVIGIPSDRYIVDADSADEAGIYGVFIAPPVDPSPSPTPWTKCATASRSGTTCRTSTSTSSSTPGRGSSLPIRSTGCRSSPPRSIAR